MNEAGRDAHDGDWEEAVENALYSLEASYGSLRDTSRALIDYSTLPVQTAYMFVYAVGRAEFTYEILRRFRRLRGAPLFGKSNLNVVSLGGGPASEVPGLMKYLNDASFGESVSAITYDVYDKEGHWEHVAEALVNKMADARLPAVSYHELDLGDAAECAKVNLGNCDLVILSFLISEICAVPNSAAIISNLSAVLATLPPGAIVLYNDSDAFSFYSCMNSVAGRVAGLNEVHEVQDTIAISGPDLTGEFEEMIERYGRSPHLNSKAVAKLLVKS